jgi:hypothetical protein
VQAASDEILHAPIGPVAKATAMYLRYEVCIPYRKVVEIFRKVCFGTRSEKGIKSHSIIPSLVQTAKRQGVHPLSFLTILLTADPATAQAALYHNSS